MAFFVLEDVQVKCRSSFRRTLMPNVAPHSGESPNQMWPDVRRSCTTQSSLVGRSRTCGRLGPRRPPGHCPTACSAHHAPQHGPCRGRGRSEHRCLALEAALPPARRWCAPGWRMERRQWTRTGCSGRAAKLWICQMVKSAAYVGWQVGVAPGGRATRFWQHAVIRFVPLTPEIRTVLARTVLGCTSAARSHMFGPYPGGMAG